MATRSTIAILREDGSVLQSYIHWDGYIQGGVGQELVTNYATAEQVENLIQLGDLITLCGLIERFADRGETDVDAREFSSLSEFNIMGQNEEYNYLFRDGAWCVRRDPEKPFLKIESIEEAVE